MFSSCLLFQEADLHRPQQKDKGPLKESPKTCLRWVCAPAACPRLEYRCFGNPFLEASGSLCCAGRLRMVQNQNLSVSDTKCHQSSLKSRGENTPPPSLLRTPKLFSGAWTQFSSLSRSGRFDRFRAAEPALFPNRPGLWGMTTSVIQQKGLPKDSCSYKGGFPCITEVGRNPLIPQPWNRLMFACRHA